MCRGVVRSRVVTVCVCTEVASVVEPVWDIVCVVGTTECHCLCVVGPVNSVRVCGCGESVCGVVRGIRDTVGVSRV